MGAKNKFVVLGAACASLAMVVFAQDDLDNLLQELGADSKKSAAQAAPAATPAEEKPAVPAPEVPAAREVKVPAAPPAPAAAPVEEKKPEPAPAAEVKPAEEKPAAPAVAEAPAPAAEEKPAEEKPAAPAVAEAPATAPAPAPVAAPAAPAPAVPEELDLPDADLLKDVIATEKLRREALEQQAAEELEDARAAMAARDWDGAYKKYRLAYAHLEDRIDATEHRKECATGMAEARYQAAKQALKDGDREAAKNYATEAQKLRHPLASAFIDALAAETLVEAVTDKSAITHRRNDADYKTDRDTIRPRPALRSLQHGGDRAEGAHPAPPRGRDRE